MKGASHLILLFLPLPFLLIPSCARQDPDVGEVRIGIIGYQEGVEGLLTRGTFQAAELAVEQANRAGGILLKGRRVPVSLRKAQIASRPEEAIEAVRRLINLEAVSAIVGPQNSRDAIPAGEAADQAGVPLISPAATHPRVTQGRTHVFRAGFVDQDQGEALARVGRELLGADRAAVLFDRTDPYCSGMAEVFLSRFQAAGGKVVSFEGYAPGHPDFAGCLKRIREKEPQVLAFPNYAGDVFSQARLARSMGIRATFLGSDGWGRSRVASYPALEGSYLTGHWLSSLPTPRNRAFVDDYRRRFGEEPIEVSALTFDSFGILLEAISLAGSCDPAAITRALTSLGPYQGATGTIDYSQGADPVKGVLVIRIQKGELEAVRTFEHSSPSGPSP